MIPLRTLLLGGLLGMACAAFPSGGAEARTLVAWFSRAGENYAVGTITEGNTAIVGRMVARALGADTFEIRPAVPYPEGYEACKVRSRKEHREDARPDFERKDEPDFSAYDTVFLGYPIWWSAPPMIIRTFLDAHDLSGKQVFLFATHEGSGMCGTDALLSSACPGVRFQSGFAIRGRTAQNDRGEAERIVRTELRRLGFTPAP